mgnify:CR=1 FL=1
MNKNDFITFNEAAERFRVSRGTIVLLKTSKLIKAYKKQGIKTLFVNVQEIESFMNYRQV